MTSTTVFQDNVGLMRELLEDYGDINKYFDSCGQTILSAAVEAEAVQCLGHLLSVEGGVNILPKKPSKFSDVLGLKLSKLSIFVGNTIKFSLF